MSERRRKYRYNRVMIESSRILNPQFDDAVVWLSGAQIEMLRNVTQYLNRLDTYVAEQFLDYYLTPDATDYDTILAIVADLEEQLMGNPNTIWGYADRWSEDQLETSVGAGTTVVETVPVPDGQVYVLEHWSLWHNEGAPRAVLLQVLGGDGNTLLYKVPALPSEEYAYQDTHITMKYGDYVRLTVYALSTDDIALMVVSGYKMVVPLG